MKTIIALTVAATLAMVPASQASGFFNKSGGGLLGNVTAALGIKNVNVLNGNTVAVGNNSSILSNIGSGNGVLGLGGQNTNTKNSGNSTNVNSGNSQSSYWGSFNKGW